MSGYFHDDAATVACTTTDGFLSAGDIAIADEEGFISIVDRAKDVIITGGTNVYPREVEDILLSDPGVADVAVIGTPDETWGERITACWVRRPGFHGVGSGPGGPMQITAGRIQGTAAVAGVAISPSQRSRQASQARTARGPR